MIDELLRLRVVKLDESDQIRLTRPAFVPDSSLAGKSVYFGRNIGDHIAAGAHNLLDGRPPMLERSVHYSRLSAEHAAELERLARQRAESMLGEINREGMRRQADSAAEPGHRINFGVYCYVDPAPVAPSEAGHEQTD